VVCPALIVTVLLWAACASRPSAAVSSKGDGPPARGRHGANRSARE